MPEDGGRSELHKDRKWYGMFGSRKCHGMFAVGSVMECLAAGSGMVCLEEENDMACLTAGKGGAEWKFMLGTVFG